MKYCVQSFILAFCISLLSIEGYSQSTPKPTSKSQLDVRWIKHQSDWFAIEYPENWQLNTDGLAGSEFFLFAPLSSDTDPFRENVNLLVQDLTGMGLNLDSYTELSETQVKTLFGDSKILLSERIQGKLGEYHRIVYSGTQGEFQLKFEQYYLIKDDKAIILTLTCEEPEFKKYKVSGERILNSFRLK